MSQEFYISVEILDGYNTQLNVLVTNSMLIKELRASIAKKLQLQTANVRLSYNDVPMRDSETIAQSDVQAYSKIYGAIFMKIISVTVTGVSGETTEEVLYLEDTVRDFLKRYQEKYSIPATIRLSFRGVELREDKILSALGVSDDDMLLVHFAVPGGQK